MTGEREHLSESRSRLLNARWHARTSSRSPSLSSAESRSLALRSAEALLAALTAYVGCARLRLAAPSATSASVDAVAKER